jgi:2-dehydropantoate 2-reductase
VKIGVMGAGAIGCYVGGRLIAAGDDVVLIGRASLAAEIEEHGLVLSSYDGRDAIVRDVRVSTDPAALADRDMVIVTVKSGDTAEVARTLAPILAPRAIVVSFQNGVGNPAVLRESIRDHHVLAGMVPFNVVRRDGARFHQGTSGVTIVEQHGSNELVRRLERAGIAARAREDVERIVWGKLLVNLANSVNALAGIPIRDMLDDRGYRRVIAACAREGLDALAKAGLRPILPLPLPPRLVPRMLALPGPLFALVRLAMPRVDPQARSSMWDDLSRGRKTEIDALNGEIVRLAERVGTRAKVNAGIVALVRRAEGGEGSPRMSSRALRDALGLA